MPDGKSTWFEVVSLELVLPHLSLEFDGFRLLQLSDLHFGTWINRSRLDEVVEIINSLNPDVIAFTGDLVSNKPDRYASELIESLTRLRPTVDVVAVRGNHDHWTDPVEIARILDACGIVHLENSVYTIPRNGAQLHLAGLDSHYEGMDRLDQVLNKLPQDGAAILLIHEPDFADTSASTGRFDLQLSGHSHGGQILFPRFGPVFLPRYARKYPLGMYRINGMIQYTNRGIGTSHLRLRYKCPAEIALLTLRAPEDQGVVPGEGGFKDRF